jgi:hypothetical protein
VNVSDNLLDNLLEYVKSGRKYKMRGLRRDFPPKHPLVAR